MTCGLRKTNKIAMLHKLEKGIQPISPWGRGQIGIKLETKHAIYQKSATFR